MAYANATAPVIDGANADFTLAMPTAAAANTSTPHTIYAGTLVMLTTGTSNILAPTTVPTTNQQLAGIAMETLTVTSTTAGVHKLQVAPKGRFVLTTSSAAQSHVGTICGWNTGSSGAPNLVVMTQTTFAVGTVVEIISATKVLVDLGVKALSGTIFASS